MKTVQCGSPVSGNILVSCGFDKGSYNAPSRTEVESNSSWGPVLTAFTIWFVHFMACWTAGEIWPHQWRANALAWSATAGALLAVGVHFGRLQSLHAQGKLPGWNYRFARGAAAIATAAVLFGALPPIVFLP